MARRLRLLIRSGTAWVLQLVELPAARSAHGFARRESAEAASRDNLAFVVKCQARLSRLTACAGPAPEPVADVVGVTRRPGAMSAKGAGRR